MSRTGGTSQGDELPASFVRLAPRVAVPENTLSFSFVSSSGPGGQNVNKRATKCVLRVAVSSLPISPVQVSRLCDLGKTYLTSGGELVISADENKSQERNRDACIERLSELVRRALVAPKIRRATKPSRGSKERRLQAKRVISDRKRGRRGEE
jgi:ribosome-associated protein